MTMEPRQGHFRPHIITRYSFQTVNCDPLLFQSPWFFFSVYAWWLRIICLWRQNHLLRDYETIQYLIVEWACLMMAAPLVLVVPPQISYSMVFNWERYEMTLRPPPLLLLTFCNVMAAHWSVCA